MSCNYKDFQNREEWLKNRTYSLGASDVASVLGVGFKTELDLWKEKTGKATAKDLSENKRVSYGTEAEQYLRALFALKNKDKYSVGFVPYRVYYHEKYPFLSCTLDGFLKAIDNGEYGVWECKTVWVNSKKTLEDWNGKIPDKYYVQICEQMAITNYLFAVLTAELVFPDGNSEVRNYTIERTEKVENDIQYVVKQAVDFWEKYVKTGKKPPVKMTL